MDLLRLFRKCRFCKKSKNLQAVLAHDIYGDVYIRYYYHQECLDYVLCNPFKAGHIKTDVAIQIIDLIEDKKTKETSKQQIFLEACNNAKTKAVKLNLLNNKRKYKHISKENE